MMKQIAFVLLLLAVNVSYCQRNLSGYYEETSGKGFVCIKDDTLSFRLPDGDYYYGSYTMEDSLIILDENLLIDRNFRINTEPCGINVLEITCNYLERQWYMDYSSENPDTNIYLRDVDNTLHRLIAFYNDEEDYKVSVDGVISFDSIELQSFGDSLSLYLFIEGTHILTRLTLPNRIGCRYSIIQKHHNMIPFLRKKMKLYSYEYRIYFNKEKTKIIFDYGDDLKVHYFEHCFILTDKNTSCMAELRKYYPDL